MTALRTRPARLYHARKRRKSLADPSLGLFRTHVITEADGAIDTDVVFENDRESPVTFAITVQADGLGSEQGLIAEFGGNADGLGLWVAGASPTDINACAGNVAADDGVTLTAEDVITTASDLPIRIVFACSPKDGRARLWINGELKASAVAAAGAFSGGWCGNNDGGLGDAFGGAGPGRVDAGDRVALAGMNIISPLSVYTHQLPQHFSIA